MRLFRTNNPVYKKVLNSEFAGTDYEVATYGGVARKAMFFIAMTLVGAFGGIFLMVNNPDLFGTLLGVSIFTSFIFAIVAMVSPRLSKTFGTLYCLGQGLVVGVVSFLFEAEAPGVVMTALLSTIVVLAVVVTLFLTNIVKVNGKFIKFLLTFAISMIISNVLIWIFVMSSHVEVSWQMILLMSGISVFLATLYLFFDLENIRQIVEGQAPSQMEWYVAFGLIFTVVWLYTQLLRIAFIIMDRS